MRTSARIMSGLPEPDSRHAARARRQRVYVRRGSYRLQLAYTRHSDCVLGASWKPPEYVVLRLYHE
jgi:hypothetical protein